MPRKIMVNGLGLIAALMVSCSVAVPQAPNAEATASSPAPTVTPVATPVVEEAFVMRMVADGLDNPLEILYGPDNYLWISERTGKRVTRVNPEDGTKHVALEIPDAFQSANQDGVEGMVFDPEFLQGTGRDYLYLSYTYLGEGGSARQPNRRVKIVRYTYDTESETLGEPVELLSNLSGSSDHNSAKFAIGPDKKIYYSIGDQGHNQFGSTCVPIMAQELPTAEEIAASDWSKYQGKVLRINLDGSIPDDNPAINGVKSHIFSYGHRNVQGLAISEEGLIYASEQGPKSDDEINLIADGKNYGWPNVTGYQDDQAYQYANWSESPSCSPQRFSDFEVPPDVPQQPESAWSDPNFTPPLYTFGTVETGYDFKIAKCAPNEWICWPTIAPTGLTLYRQRQDGMPGWKDSLLVSALKRGTVYRLELSADGQSIVGEAKPYFKTTNRYRALAIGPDGRTFYVITDSDNWTLGSDDLPTDQLENPGAILEFRYSSSE